MKSMTQLMKEIQQAEDITVYLKENEELIQRMELSNYLETMLEKHDKRPIDFLLIITYNYYQQDY